MWKLRIKDFSRHKIFGWNLPLLIKWCIQNKCMNLESCWYSLLKILQCSTATSVISKWDTFLPWGASLCFKIFNYLFFNASEYFHRFSYSKPKIISILNFEDNFVFNFVDILLSEYPSGFHAFWWHTRNNFVYLLQNMIHQAIQIGHSMFELIF